MGFVTAYAADTGVKHDVPEDWLDHPVLGRNLRRTPSDRAATQTLSPFDSWTVDQLKEYAAEHDVDVSGATRKPELLEAITRHHNPAPAGPEE